MTELISGELLYALLGLIAELMILVYTSFNPRKEAFEQYERCIHLLHKVQDVYRRMRDDMIGITTCLSEKKDRRDIEDLLFRYSNMLAELESFVEKGCPTIHRKVTGIVWSNVGRGILMLLFAIVIALIAPNYWYVSLLYGGVGYALIYRSQPSSSKVIEDFRITLAELEDYYKITASNLMRLCDRCKKRTSCK